MIILSRNIIKTGLFALFFLLFDLIEYNTKIPLIYFFGGSLSFMAFIFSLKNYCIIGATLLAFVFYFLHNFIATGWLLSTTYSDKAFLVFIANAFLMLFPTIFWYLSSKIIKIKDFLFVLIWTGFEFIHFRWSLSWPWLSFGHSLVKVVETIQWYEYTGVLGGTMWFLLAGHLLYKYISTKKRQLFILFTGIILIPLIISFSLLQLSWDQNVNEINVRIIHTNFYAQSEHNNTNYERIKLVTSHLKYKNDINLDYILLPEYFFNTPFTFKKCNNTFEIKILQSHLKRYHLPKTRLIFGVELIDDFNNRFNSVIELSQDSITNIYIKEKLIPFQERTPVGFEFLNIPSDELSNRTNFTNSFSPRHINGLYLELIPAICYESIYGYHLSNKVHVITKKTSGFFFFSNESFMNSTKGIDQYFNIIKLRAIENRKPIARTSNLGYTAFISPSGIVESIIKGNHLSSIVQKIRFNVHKTIYSRYPNLTGIVNIVLSLSIVIYAIIGKIRS